MEDGLGMAIFYRTNSIIELSEDEHSYLVILKPNNGLVDYYFSGTWQQDIDGFSNKGEFLSDLNRTLKQLNTPLQMLFNNQ
ncbi:MAG: DUF4861 family protein [Kangiellaceae bacterium]|nr:DUF4861 family protein [Kangiellaceae bacterium]